MAQQTSWLERVRKLRHPVPAVAISMVYNEMALAIGLAAQRAGEATDADPTELIARLAESKQVSKDAAELFAELQRSYYRVAERLAEPTPEEAGEFERYARAVTDAVSEVGH